MPAAGVFQAGVLRAEGCGVDQALGQRALGGVAAAGRGEGRGLGGFGVPGAAGWAAGQDEVPDGQNEGHAEG